MGCMKCTSIIIIFLCPSRKRSADRSRFDRSFNIQPNVHFLHGVGLTPAIFGFHVRVTLIKFFLLLLEVPDFSLPCLPCNQRGASNQDMHASCHSLQSEKLFAFFFFLSPVASFYLFLFIAFALPSANSHSTHFFLALLHPPSLTTCISFL